MPSLQFTRDLADRIRADRKSQTLRGKLPPGTRVGVRVTLLNGYHSQSVIGHGTIIAVDLVDSSELTDLDAELDGFDSLEELQGRLREMRRPDQLWRIRWRDFTPAR